MWKERPWLVVGLVALGGVLGLGAAGISASMIESTSTNEFCVSCHEMTWPQEDYRKAPHFTSASGVRPGCKDCHIPHDGWYNTVAAKLTQGTRDIWLHMMGKLDSEEKYRAHRAEMAERVWARLERNDSNTCRGCHVAEAMDFEKQNPAAALMHARAQQGGVTCITCHKGIGHGKPEATALN